jgi:Ca-activated chloride channel family protein
VFLSVFNHRPTLVATWATPPLSLSRRLDAVRPFGGTAIYDALVAAAPVFTRRRHQRAAVVVISDGDDTASDATVHSVRSAMRRSDAFVYALAIEVSDPRSIGTHINAQVLRDITGDSGGYTEVVKDSAELSPATARIAEELNHQYVLGYTPTRPPDGQYRSIRVKVQRHADFVVRARRGYLATVRR